jgi:hypothetical protein
MAPPKLMPLTVAPTAAGVAASTPPQQPPQHNSHAKHHAPGHFGGAVFRYGRPALAARPAPRSGPTRRPRRPSAGQLLGNDEMDLVCDTERDGALTASQGQHPQDQSDDSSDQDQKRDQQQSANRFRMQVGAAASQGSAPSVPVVDGKPADYTGAQGGSLTLRQFTDRALATLDRLSTGPAMESVRQTLLSDALCYLNGIEVSPPQVGPTDRAGNGLEAVRTLLIEATRRQPGCANTSVAQQEMNQLLPLLLLMLTRPRSPLQSQACRAKLLAMVRRQA